MNRSGTAVLLTFLLFVCNSPGVAAKSQKSMQLVVQPSCDNDGRCVLRVQLKNTSSEPITLYESLLPWRYNGMVLVVSENRAPGKVLAPFLAIDDPTSETVVVAAGKTLDGSIELQSRFPGLSDARRDTDLLVFWSYQPIGPRLKTGPRLSGSTIIPRSAPAR